MRYFKLLIALSVTALVFTTMLSAAETARLAENTFDLEALGADYTCDDDDDDRGGKNRKKVRSEKRKKKNKAKRRNKGNQRGGPNPMDVAPELFLDTTPNGTNDPDAQYDGDYDDGDSDDGDSDDGDSDDGDNDDDDNDDGDD